MTEARSALLRCAIAATLIFVLALTGVGRGFAVASMPAEMTVTIGDIVVPICHNAAGDSTGVPGKPAYDCCDTCALLAPANLPTPPALSSPAVLAYFIEHTRAMTWVPAFARVRTPRQSQGPPQTA